MKKNQEWLSQLPDSVHNWLEGKRVDDVECIIADIAGIARGKAMPAKKFARSEQLYLPCSIFFQTITGDYATIEGLENQWTEADLILKPDYSAAQAVPWSADITLQAVHDAFDNTGKPIPLAPRNVLRHVLSLYEANGWRPVVAPEIEFYLTKPNANGTHPIEPPIGRSGRQGIGRQAYSMSAVEEYGAVIDDIYDFAEAQGMEIDTIIQEGGAGQIEINLLHGDPIALADEVFFFKRLIREAALRHDCFATFMAKPMEDQPGSAMHLHQSVIDVNTGRNIFNDEQGNPTDFFYGFIGGLQSYIPAAFSLLAPYVNSYRRFVRDESAPINLEWGADNRTTGLRIPLSNAESRRVENRVIGMDCNPYLGIAASLACGYLGMKNNIAPREELKSDAYSLPFALPRDLTSALELFDKCDPLETALGFEFCRLYKSIKRHEIEEFLQVISPWERDHLLLNV